MGNIPIVAVVGGCRRNYLVLEKEIVREVVSNFGWELWCGLANEALDPNGHQGSISYYVIQRLSEEAERQTRDS